MSLAPGAPPREGWRSQLAGEPPAPDDEALAGLRLSARGYDGYMGLGAALTDRLRYREAADAYALALRERPGDLAATRQRAGRLLSTLRCAEAREGLERCLAHGGEPVDLYYRLGLASFYDGDDDTALARWEACLPLCGDEMAVAVMYWHSLASLRSGRAPGLLGGFREGMEVGHHTAYEASLRLIVRYGEGERATELRDEVLALGESLDDMDFSIVAYAAASLIEGRVEKRVEGDSASATAASLRSAALARDGFWPSYAFIAAWNDARRPRG